MPWPLGRGSAASMSGLWVDLGGGGPPCLPSLPAPALPSGRKSPVGRDSQGPGWQATTNRDQTGTRLDSVWTEIR